MAHLAESERHSAEGAPMAPGVVARAVKGVVNWLGGGAIEDAPNPNSASLGSTDNKPGQLNGAFGPEVAGHLREILESGYIEEKTGKRVHVPSYIRSQLVSELRLLS